MLTASFEQRFITNCRKCVKTFITALNMTWCRLYVADHVLNSCSASSTNQISWLIEISDWWRRPVRYFQKPFFELQRWNEMKMHGICHDTGLWVTILLVFIVYFPSGMLLVSRAFKSSPRVPPKTNGFLFSVRFISAKKEILLPCIKAKRVVPCSAVSPFPIVR